MTGILKSAPNAHFDNQEKQTNHEALIGFSWFLYLGPDQTVAENRLISATNSGAGINASYTYDGDGNRVSKTVNGVRTDYVVDTQNPTGYAQVLAEIQGGEVVKRYTYGHDLISMERKDGSNWIASYYGYDGTGSVRALTDASGTVTDNYDYDAFGTLLYSSGSTPNDYLFHGERKDPETGLVYLRARYMDGSIGRFMTMDSFEGDNQDPQSLHKYVFAKNNSINGNDPSGLSSDDQSIAAGYGGVFRTILETVFASIYSYASSITVFVWNYQNVGAAGHVSMNLNTYNEYVSWWPMNEGYPSWLRLLENAYWHTPAFQDRTLDDDIRGEGREPDHEIHLTSYSEMRVVNWWRGYKTSHSWNVYTGNCAIIVANGLERAGAKGKPADFMMKPSPEFLNWVGLLKAQELGLGKGK